MTQSRGPLVACLSCTRHVFASEASCPFCAVALPRDLAARAPRGATGRMTRAEQYRLNAGPRALDASMLGAAVGGVRLGQLEQGPGIGGQEDPGSSFAMYGAPGPSFTDPGTASPDPGSSFAMYGAPGTFDNPGQFENPDPSWNTPNEDPGSSFAMYGAPGDFENPGEHTEWDQQQNQGSQGVDGQGENGFDAMGNANAEDWSSSGANDFGSDQSGNDFGGNDSGGSESDGSFEV
ncbi:MAG: hypothetical protein U0235_32225 [Polyangiaceae bacterium]